MKNLLFLFLMVILSSCKNANDDPIKQGPTITGTWDKICTPKTDATFSGTLTIVQQSDNKITGNFVSKDNSFYGLLTSSSIINGNSVTIAWTIPATSTYLSYTYYFQGTANSTFNSMNGTYYFDLPTNERRTGTWVANKK